MCAAELLDRLLNLDPDLASQNLLYQGTHSLSLLDLEDSPMTTYFVGGGGRPLARGALAHIQNSRRIVVGALTAFFLPDSVRGGSTGIVIQGLRWACMVRSRRGKREASVVLVGNSMEFRDTLICSHDIEFNAPICDGAECIFGLPSKQRCEGTYEVRRSVRRLCVVGGTRWRAEVDDGYRGIPSPNWGLICGVATRRLPLRALRWESDQLFSAWGGDGPSSEADRIVLLSVAAFVKTVFFCHDDPG